MSSLTDECATLKGRLEGKTESLQTHVKTVTRELCGRCASTTVFRQYICHSVDIIYRSRVRGGFVRTHQAPSGSATARERERERERETGRRERGGGEEMGVKENKNLEIKS